MCERPVGALIAGNRKGFVVPVLGVPDEWVWMLVLPWFLGAAGIMTAVVFLKRVRSRELAGTLLATGVLAATSCW